MNILSKCEKGMDKMTLSFLLPSQGKGRDWLGYIANGAENRLGSPKFRLCAVGRISPRVVDTSLR